MLLLPAMMSPVRLLPLASSIAVVDDLAVLPPPMV